jgi:hypothetical protein
VTEERGEEKKEEQPQGETPGKEVAIPEQAVLPQSIEDVKALIADNLETVDKPEFPRIKMLHAGALQFELPTSLEGEKEKVEEIEGVILYIQKVRGRWQEAYSGGNKLPVCSSMDGKHGFDTTDATPAKIPCKSCPFSQFGSDPSGGRGQACKEMRRIYLRIGTDLMPTLITTPPSSIKVVDGFLVKLVSAGMRYSDIRCTLKLEDSSNTDGIHYSKLILIKSKKDLTKKELDWAKALKDGFIEYMKQEPIEIADLAGHVDNNEEDDVPF